jgi:oligosaccharide repeat unit polymerase
MDSSALEWSLAAYALIVFVCLYAVARKYRTVVNPLSYYAAVFAMQTLIMPFVFLRLNLIDLHQYRVSDLAGMVWLSALHVTCIAAAYRCGWSPLQAPLVAITPTRPLRITLITQIAMAIQALALFAMLAFASGAGTLWFTNPRMAYQTCRDGAGVWWSLCQASLILAFCCTLLKKKRSPLAVFALAISFGSIAYFLGSKTFTLYYLVLSVFYVQHHVSPIGKGKLAAVAALALLAISSLQIMQGTAATVLDTVEYFDYATNTTKFLSDFNQMFGHTYGKTLASELWFYVPRPIYPAKPYAYGTTEIMETYFPGAAEKGNTAGILPWAGPYWDFGVVGVVLQALFIGFLSKAAFDHFRRSGSIWSILMLGQVGFMSITAQTFLNAPLPVFAVWLFIEWIILRVVGIRVFPRNPWKQSLVLTTAPELA